MNVVSLLWAPCGRLKFAWSTDGAAPVSGEGDALIILHMVHRLLGHDGPPVLLTDERLERFAIATYGALWFIADLRGAEHLVMVGYEDAVEQLRDYQREAA